jgi:hypothetical protein
LFKPHRYDIIFGGANGNGHGSIDGILHSSSITYQNHYSNEYFQAAEEVAKPFLNILTTQIVDNTMATAAAATVNVK